MTAKISFFIRYKVECRSFNTTGDISQKPSQIFIGTPCNKVESCRQCQQKAGTSRDAKGGASRDLGATANEMHRDKKHKSKGRK